jgi:hypothetical protein
MAELRSLMSKCTKGSLQWRRYNKALKRANAEARAGLPNIDHQVSHKVAQIVHDHESRKSPSGMCERPRLVFGLKTYPRTRKTKDLPLS